MAQATLCKPAAAAGVRGSQPRPHSSWQGRARSGDPPIVGVARPANLSDSRLTNWTVDGANPIVVVDTAGKQVCERTPAFATH